MTGLSHEVLVEFRGYINAIEATVLRGRVEQHLKDIIKLAKKCQRELKQDTFYVDS